MKPALFFAFLLLLLPFASAGLFDWLYPEPQVVMVPFYPKDVNFNTLGVSGNAWFDQNLYADTIVSRLQVNQIEIDLHVVNDANFQGSIQVGGQSFMEDFVNLHANPTEQLHAATKEYVDTAVSGLDFVFYLTDSASDISNYFDLVDTDTGEAESSHTSIALNAGLDQNIFSFATLDGEPEFETLFASIYDGHFHCEKTGGVAKTVTIYWKLFERNSSGIETELIQSEDSEEIFSKEPINIHGALSEDEQIDGNRLVVTIYANVVGGGATAQVICYQEGETDSHISLKAATTSLSQLYLLRSGTNWMTGDLNLGDQDLINGKDANFAGIGVSSGSYLNTLTATGDTNLAMLGISEYIFMDKNAYVADTIYSTRFSCPSCTVSGSGATALGGHGLTTLGPIASGIGSFAFGYLDEPFGPSTTSLSALCTGCFAGGFVESVPGSSGTIFSSGRASFAFGYLTIQSSTQTATISANAFGAVAMGYCEGDSGPGILNASGNGAIAMGVADGENAAGMLTATNVGSIAMGAASSDVVKTATLSSSGRGSIAMGYAGDTAVANATLSSSGTGSVAMGLALDGNLLSTGTGSVSLGLNSQATKAHATAIGYLAVADVANGMNLASFVSIGGNSLIGLDVGDINATEIIYDVATQKSPAYFRTSDGNYLVFCYPAMLLGGGTIMVGEWTEVDTKTVPATIMARKAVEHPACMQKKAAIEQQEADWRQFEAERQACEDETHSFSNWRRWGESKQGTCSLYCTKAGLIEEDGKCRERTPEEV